MNPEEIERLIDQATTRFDMTVGGVVEVPSLSERLSNDLFVSDGRDGYLPAACRPCGSFADDLEFTPFENRWTKFDRAFPNDTLVLSLAGAPHTVSPEWAQRAYKEARLAAVDDDEVTVHQVPRASEILSVTATFVLHAEGKGSTPIAVMSAGVLVLRSGQDIGLRAYPHAARVFYPDQFLRPAIASSIGYLTGMHLGYFVRSLEFDPSTRWCLYQTFPDELDGFVDPDEEVFEDSEIDVLAQNRFIHAFRKCTVSDDDVRDARDMVKDPQYRETYLSHAALTLHWPGSDYYLPLEHKAMRAFAPRAQALESQLSRSALALPIR